MNDLQTSITTVSDEFLNSLFSDEPVKNIDENSLALGKSGVKVEKDNKDDVIKTGQQGAEIPYLDVNSLEDNLDPLTNKPKEEEVVVKEAEKKEPVKETPKKKTEEPQAASADIQVLRNTAKYLIEKGYWKDFENRDETLSSLTEDGYAELAEKQYEEIRSEIKRETIDSTGDYGKAIIEYTQNGGNPDEVIDLFKEQKTVENIAIDTEAGQKLIIEKFYTEVYDWTPEHAKKYINTLISSDELESEAQEVDTKYKNFFKQEVEVLQLRQQAAKKKELDDQKAFAQTINSKLVERKDFTEKDRKLIQESVFKHDSVLPDGTKVNKFYLKFAEMNKNPDDYLDLVHFVMNKEGYNAKVKSKEETQKVDKKWSFISKNASVATTTGSKHDETREPEKVVNLDFSSVLNK